MWTFFICNPFFISQGWFAILLVSPQGMPLGALETFVNLRS